MWRGVRATEPGLLDGIAGRGEPPEDAPAKEGGFNFVTDVSGGRVKALPSLYVNNTQVYAARDPEAVRDKLHRAVDAFLSSDRVPTYMLTACEIGGRKGLFGTDFFNRSSYRQKMKRLGMTFSEDLYVMMDSDGAFYAEDREPFTPEFVTFPTMTPPPPSVTRVTGAYVVYRLSYYRIADIDADELSKIVALASSIEALRPTEPSELAEALTGASPAA